MGDRPAPDRPDPDRPDPGRRRLLGLAVTGAVVVAGGGGLAWRFLDDGAPSGATAGPDPAARHPSLAVTAETLPPLPLPADLPADPNAPTPPVVLGTLTIPRIGLSAAVQEGITLTAINRGPGHWPGTAMPGQLGNVVVAGHRTLFGHPFRHLDQLQPGDAVVFALPGGTFSYQVRGVVVVDGQAVDIAAQARAHTATLFACHPPGSAAQRIVAKLRLLGPDGRPADPDAALPPVEAGTQAGGHTLRTGSADPLADSHG